MGERYAATILSSLEMFYGLGNLMGSAIGGALYDSKGFYFPFFIVGIIIILCFFAAIFTIHEPNSDITNEQESSSKATYKELLIQSTVIVCLIMTCVSQVSVTWYITTLEPFLRDNFALESTTAGLILSFNGLSFGLIGLLMGALLDRYLSTYIVMSTGVTATITGLGLLGPVAYMKILPQSIYTTGVALVLLG